MKRLRSSDDLNSFEKSGGGKESNQNLNRSLSSHRSSSGSGSGSGGGFYYNKPSSTSDSIARSKSNLISSSSSSRYDRDRSGADEDSGRERDRDALRIVRKRSDHDFESFDRRKLGFDRYRDGASGSNNALHRSESFCGPRRDFPKGFRSERDRTRRDGGSGSSWRRFGVDENRFGSKAQLRELRDAKSPTWGRDSSGPPRLGGEGREREELRDAKSPAWSRDSLGSPRVGGEGREKEELRNAKLTTWSRDSLGATRVGGEGKEREELRDAKSPSWSRDSLGAARVGGEGKEREEFRDTKSPLWSRDSLVATRVGGEGREREELRDAKSPSWSRDSLGDTRVGGEGREKEDLRRRSSKSMSKSRSPTRSRDSESEQSKSVGGGGEVKKSNDMPDEGRSSSEMEEGELEPEPLVEPEPEADNKEAVIHERKECSNREIETEGACGKTNPEDGIKQSESKGNNEEMDVDESQNSERNQHSEARGNRDGVEVVDENGGGKEEECGKNDGEFEERTEDKVFKSSLHLEENNRSGKGIGTEMMVDKNEVEEREKEVAGESRGAKESMDAAGEGLSLSFKDKGKGVAIPLMEVAVSADNGQWNEREPQNEDDGIEGPSTRGFDLFSCSPVRKVEKVGQSGIGKLKEENLTLEPLDLSLSLPNVLLPLGAKDANAVPGSPSQGKSVQSFNTLCTNSDGFTQSMSFSGSQSFYHNPSCSLTQNSMHNSVDYEQSVHSRPIFQGIDQVLQESGQVQNESRHKDRPIFQRLLMNGNGSVHQSQALQGVTDGQVVHGQHSRDAEGSSKKADGLDRQLSFHKHGDGRSPATSLDVGSNYSFEKKRSIREEHSGGLFRSSSQKDKQLLIGGAAFVETIICRIISDPIHIMARKFHEMTGQSIACLKESIREAMLNADKRGQLSAIQSALQNRSELSLETLLKSHRAQLEILVALKTGLPEYLQLDKSIPSSDLAEIFLNLKCRNLTCRSPLPVDECDCKVCSRKKGFCSACMCLVCSKFDMASNTCSWVGCDVCLHWCHADCGLRESYIRNGHSANAAQGTTEMQFHCVACDHPSEMFGFVKEVFQNFANEWTPETFSRELEYVKRVFSGSKDIRGKRLHEIAIQMLARLANKADIGEVHGRVLAFLTESQSSKLGNTSVVPGKEHGKRSNGVAGPSNETWLKSSHSDIATPKLESSSSSFLPSSFHVNRTDRHPRESDLQRDAQKQQTLMPELESFIRIKQEEAKMYQAHADDARREAEGLKRIANAKNEKIEEEYMTRITKLRLLEAEETRRQKLDEFQALERSHREYFSMKMRMEADIKDLLLKMEATRRNLS